MKLYSENSFAKIYQQVLTDLINDFSYIVAPRRATTYENTNIIINLKNPLNNLFKNAIRSTNKRYLSSELVWYFAGDNTIDFISKYAKLWKKILNLDNKTVNSNYGYIIFKEHNEYGISEWSWAYNCLIKDEDTRQAIIRFNKPGCSFENNKDFVCTLNAIFFIRNNFLNMTIYQRSSDAITGIIYDLPFFTILHQQMYSHLKEKYQNLKIGEVFHYINSIHIYEKHIGLATEMLKHDFLVDGLPKLSEDLITVYSEPNIILEQLLTLNEKKSDINDELLTWISENLQIESNDLI